MPKKPTKKTSNNTPSKPQNEDGNSDNNLEQVGACWIQESAKGNKYMSCVINEDISEGDRVLIFRNNYKEEDKHPDYRIYRATDAPSHAGTDSDEDMPF